MFGILCVDRAVGNHVIGERGTGPGLELGSPEVQRHHMSEDLPILLVPTYLFCCFIRIYQSFLKKCNNIFVRSVYGTR